MLFVQLLHSRSFQIRLLTSLFYFEEALRLSVHSFPVPVHDNFYFYFLNLIISMIRSHVSI